ncbi:MAG TPA: L,D-transpeptidase [Gemmatimonadaceae bacterium]|nr:L,D-transpeptidase [Gemmatimonadaceae bacterium]
MRAQSRYMVVASVAMIGALAAWRAGSSGPSAADECAGAPNTPPAVHDTTAELRLVLNLPAYRLDVLEDGRIESTIPVAVGQRKYPTPIGHYRLDYVVWNPWWHPPDRWWARHEKVTAPGWANPVGRVKLHVTELIFMHGTPFEASRGSAASHACIRMSNADAIALARLVHSRAGPPLPPGELDDLVADTSRTRTLVLSRTVPVDIDYDLAEVRDGALWLWVDVYRFAGTRVASVQSQALTALTDFAAGGADAMDTAIIDTTRLRALVRVARRAPAHLPVESLFVRNVALPDARSATNGR